MKPEDVSMLVIDDEKMIVDQVSCLFSELGYQVTGLSDSQVALKLIEEQKFDVILTDLNMPVVSGMDIVKTINSQHCDTQLIIFTGYATIDSAVDALKNGVYSYICKPYNINELRATVEKAANELFLKRENIRLNHKIKTMFEYMTSIHEIVSILYQVSDFNMAIEMVLDTLTEGIQIESAFIALLDNQDLGYKIHSAIGLPAEFMKDFELKLGDPIGEQPLAGKSVQHIFIDERLKETNSDLHSVVSDFRQIILQPIVYREKVLGFLGTVDQSENVFSIDDYLQLLEMIATQIGPIIHTNIMEEIFTKSTTFNDIAERVISENIEQAEKSHCILSFALIQLVKNPDIKEIPPLERIKASFKNIIQKQFDDYYHVVWQKYDSALAIAPHQNSVVSELNCSRIKSEIEKCFQNGAEERPISLHYSVADYPNDGLTPVEIISSLNARLIAT
jgi:FixJ family two-component response regulator